MIFGLFVDDIRALFFLALRLMAAAGGFFVGWFLTTPLVSTGVWLATRKSVPRWLMAWLKLGVGMLVALLVFWYLPLGTGGGGGGSGGGTGKGVGPGKGDSSGAQSAGDGSGQKDGTGPAAKSGSATASSTPATEILTIELLGGDAVKEGRYYLIDRKQPAADSAAVGHRLDDLQAKLAGIDVVLTEQSVGESHQAVRLLVQMAQDRKLRSRILTPGQNK
jgi:hypothetical protein